jgi:hypothetical protein
MGLMLAICCFLLLIAAGGITTGKAVECQHPESQYERQEFHCCKNRGTFS